MPWKVPVYLSKEICIYKKPRNLRGFLKLHRNLLLWLVIAKTNLPPCHQIQPPEIYKYHLLSRTHYHNHNK